MKLVTTRQEYEARPRAGDWRAAVVDAEPVSPNWGDEEPRGRWLRWPRGASGACGDRRRAHREMNSTFAPGVAKLSSYQARWLRRDIVAGLVLTALLVPQGMAYAELAGLPAITGLYTSILCLVAYALFGPSRILVLGPDSSLGPMIAATIIPLVGARGDPHDDHPRRVRLGPGRAASDLARVSRRSRQAPRPGGDRPRGRRSRRAGCAHRRRRGQA
jgi:Sulfate permease family